MSNLPRGSTIRRDAGLYGYERALRRAGLAPVAGVDEAGRGACAGPLVAAAAILPEGKAGLVPELADSKLLTAKARERCYAQVTRRALAWSVVVIESEECDRLGMHVANVEALRRALARLDVRPAYVLTDGFPVDGLGVPGLAMWKGDRVAACISAASVIAKVTRDRIMTEMELTLYREYRDVVGIFKYVVETDRRFYLCNQVDVKARTEAGDVFFEVSMTDAWVWDMYRPARFAKNVKVLTFKDVNVEELNKSDDIELPKG